MNENKLNIIEVAQDSKGGTHYLFSIRNRETKDYMGFAFTKRELKALSNFIADLTEDIEVTLDEEKEFVEKILK